MALDECQVYSMVLDTIAARMSNFVTSPTGSVQPYKYTGKELDRENGLDTYDFEARCYDPALATTWQQDPLALPYQQSTKFPIPKDFNPCEGELGNYWGSSSGGGGGDTGEGDVNIVEGVFD